MTVDIDSARLNRFDEEDLEGIESIASVFLSLQNTDDLPISPISVRRQLVKIDPNLPLH